MVFDDVRVPSDAMLGGVGDGFLIAQKRLGPGRIHHCMRWIGQAKRAFDMLCERATYRQAHGGPLAEKQTVRNWIADSAAEIQAARLMTLNAAWMIDQHGTAAARKEIAYIKYYGAKVLHDVIDRAIQINGSLGFSGDLPLERMYRAARRVPVLRRPRRGAPRQRRAADPSGLRSPARQCSHRTHPYPPCRGPRALRRTARRNRGLTQLVAGGERGVDPFAIA